MVERASLMTCGVANNVGSAARQIPMAPTRTKSAGSRRRARAAQKRCSTMVPERSHSVINKVVIR